MSDRLRDHHKKAISELPKKLKDLSEDIEWKASDLDCSFHDAMCHFYERGEAKNYSESEIKLTLTAMGSYWD